MRFRLTFLYTVNIFSAIYLKYSAHNKYISVDKNLQLYKKISFPISVATAPIYWEIFRFIASPPGISIFFSNLTTPVRVNQLSARKMTPTRLTFDVRRTKTFFQQFTRNTQHVINT